jgi:hypothetical protein
VRRGPPGWQPSRFLTDRAEDQRAFQLAERLGSVTAAAAELGTTWPSPGKSFACHAWACPRNPEAGQEHQLAGLAVEMAGRQLIEQATGRLGYPWCSSAAGATTGPCLIPDRRGSACMPTLTILARLACALARPEGALTA